MKYLNQQGNKHIGFFYINRKKKKESDYSAKRLVILHEKNSPTLAYFLPAFEKQFQELPRVFYDINSDPPDYNTLKSGDIVIVVRYLTIKWRKILQANRNHLVKIIYFMDDDLLDKESFKGLPVAYVRRLKAKATTYNKWLKKNCSDFWVGSEFLAKKYAQLQPSVISPTPTSDVAETIHSYVKVAYHGTASHKEELIWLKDIFENVLQKNHNIHIEIFGDKSIANLYRSLPRVSILHPMSWDHYISYVKMQPADIALAPLLISPFNSSRGYTKYFDIARMGAAGIYSNVEPYRSFVNGGFDGLLLDNDPIAWEKAIVDLSNSQYFRKRIADACRQRTIRLISSYS